MLIITLCFIVLASGIQILSCSSNLPAQLIDESQFKKGLTNLHDRVGRFNLERQGKWNFRSWWTLPTEHPVAKQYLNFGNQSTNIIYPPTFLHIHDEIFVFGVNHETTGAAEVSSISVYDLNTNKPLLDVYPTKFKGSAAGWFSKTEFEGLADNYYVIKLAFACKHNEKYCVQLPTIQGEVLRTGFAITENYIPKGNLKHHVLNPWYFVEAADGDVQMSLHFSHPQFLLCSFLLAGYFAPVWTYGATGAFLLFCIAYWSLVRSSTAR